MDWENFRVHKRLALNPSIVEKVYAILSTIDVLKNNWMLTSTILSQTIKRLTHLKGCKKMSPPQH